MKAASYALAGLVVGLLLGFGLFRNDTVVRRERLTPAVENIQRLDRSIDRLTQLLDRDRPQAPRQAGRPPFAPAKNGETTRPASSDIERPSPPGASSLRALALDPPLEQDLRQLAGDPNDDADKVGDRLNRRFQLMTCREILTELGKPTEIRNDGGVLNFDYRFTDVAGDRKLIRFEFVGRLVCQVSIWRTSG